MNVNPDSEDFGKIVPWDSLTDEQKQSGDWIQLQSSFGEPKRARPKSPIEKLFRPSSASSVDSLANLVREKEKALKREFDAVGKPR